MTFEEIVKGYFETGNTPSEEQFAEFLSYIRFKDAKLPMAEVSGLTAYLNSLKVSLTPTYPNDPALPTAPTISDRLSFRAIEPGTYVNKGGVVITQADIDDNLFVTIDWNGQQWSVSKLINKEDIKGVDAWAEDFIDVVVGDKILRKLIGYKYGSGEAPTANVGQYVAPNGFTADAAVAINYKGLKGEDGPPLTQVVGNNTTLTISNILGLRSVQGAAGSFANTKGYYIDGDGGANAYYWDDTNTENDNGGSVIKVNGVANGRWLMAQKGGWINFLQWGGKSNFAFGGHDPETFPDDNIPIFESIQTWYKSQLKKTFTGIYFPKVQIDHRYGFLCKNPLDWHCDLNIKFDPGAKLIFYRTRGVTIYGSGHPLGGSDGILIINPTIYQNYYTLFQEYKPAEHGLRVENKSTVISPTVQGFRGDGIVIAGNAAGIKSGDGVITWSNANNAVLTNAFSYYNAGRGIVFAGTCNADGTYLRGGDSNAITVSNPNTVRNGICGVFDYSFLNIDGGGGQASDNGNYGGNNTWSTKDGDLSAKQVTRPTIVYTGSSVWKIINGVKYFAHALRDNINVDIPFQTNADWFVQDAPATVPALYISDKYYNLYDYAIGSDGILYRSRHNGIIGIDPATNHGPNVFMGISAVGQQDKFDPIEGIGYNPLKTYNQFVFGQQQYKVRYYAPRKDLLGVDPGSIEYHTPNYTYKESDWTGLAQKYDPALQLFAGGGYMVIDGNTSSKWLGVYTENGQLHNVFNSGMAQGFLQEVLTFGCVLKCGFDGYQTGIFSVDSLRGEQSVAIGNAKWEKNGDSGMVGITDSFAIKKSNGEYFWTIWPNKMWNVPVYGQGNMAGVPATKTYFDGAGNIIENKIFLAAPTLDFPSVPANSQQSLAVIIAGLLASNFYKIDIIGPNTNGIIYKAYVSADDTVTVVALNLTGAAVDPASGIFKLIIEKV